jgi:hypothetical protein
MPQEPKRPVSELSPAELRTIVGNILKLLLLDVAQGNGPRRAVIAYALLCNFE